MKPSDVIYWNQFSGKTELFMKSDMHNAKTCQIYEKNYYTEHLAEQLILDRKNEFTMRDYKFISTNLLENLSAPKMNKGKIRLTCIVKITEQTDDYLDISVTEIKEDVSHALPIGKIKLLRNLQTPINGIHAKAAVIIYDVAAGQGTQQTNMALGALAMAYGTYFLIKMDGDWQRIGKSYKDLLDIPGTQISLLTKENDTLKAKIFELNNALATITSNVHKEKLQLEKTIREQSRLISTLRQQNKALTISYRENPPQHIRPIIKQPPKDHFADFVDTARTQKFCFVGGTEKWQTKINKNIPGAYCINTINFDDSLIREADILVINTTFTGHALTARAKQIATAANKQVLYTSKVNLNNMAKELLRGLSRL